MRSTTEIIMTYIQGEGLAISKKEHVNCPAWFLWLMVGSGVVCCLSCLVWLVSSLLFLLREKPCTHPVQMIIIEEEEHARSPKKNEDLNSYAKIKRSSKSRNDGEQPERKESVVQIENPELGNA